MPTYKRTHSPMAKKVTTHCSTEMTCRCFSILDLQGHNAKGRSCRAERMLQPVPGDTRCTRRQQSIKYPCEDILLKTRLHRSLNWWGGGEAFGDKIKTGQTQLVVILSSSWFELNQLKSGHQTKRLMISYTHSNNVAKRVLHKLLTSSIHSHAYKSEATQLHVRSPCAKREHKVTDTLRATKASQAHTAESQ